jgi:hypothetical protein
LITEEKEKVIACCQCRVGPHNIQPGQEVKEAYANACETCKELPFKCTDCGIEQCAYLDWDFGLGPLPTGVDEMCDHCAGSRCGAVCCDVDKCERLNSSRLGWSRRENTCCNCDIEDKRLEVEEMCDPCRKKKLKEKRGKKN